MSSDSVTWIAAEAGFPLVEETAQGRVRANDAALQLLRGRSWHDLREAVAAIVRVHPRDPRLGRLLDEARAGRKDSALLGESEGRVEWRCFAAPTRTGRLRVLCVPDGATRVSELAQRAAAVDLAAEVSHEVANALGAISGWARQTRQTLEGPAASVTARPLALIETRAEEARAASRRLLATARGSARPAAAGILDLSEILQEVAELLEPLATRQGVRIELSVEPGLPVRAARADLFTVAWNLAKNACEALGAGGRLRLSSAAVEAGWAELVVEDDGPGIPPHALPRVFDAYFTTKETGTGLGLPLVRRTAEELGGDVEVASPPGPGERGTRFVVSLPLAAAAPAAPGSAPAPRGRGTAAAAGARRDSGVLDRPLELAARVLVVDDDEALRTMMQTTLELRGAYVVATDGLDPDAFALGPFDVAVVDQHLDGVHGDELVAHLRATGAARHAVIMSGGSIPPGARRSAAPDGWLRKPFDPDELVTIVRRFAAPLERTASGG